MATSPAHTPHLSRCSGYLHGEPWEEASPSQHRLGVFAHPERAQGGLGLTMVKTVYWRLWYSFDVGSRRLSLKLLLRMRKESGTRRSSWTAVGRRTAALLGSGRPPLLSTAVGVCLGAVLP